ncbi:DDE-type integrase/transposase/recombinase [Sulfitobacter sabulilitoris]|uniref:DDE-type integrase/transposase/recombinase n=1 Tax=Sulfitobacter sabulilitoris TaxID=2562655 RepID=A0A5S3PZS1_9RHOB|nr:DDE-type integrase/transposase/recombinase [Sulfitobacter sabulilitoris]TMM49533.1 DDE-type integrase/transposase/recombinase [Sulfitobacter sabulilitoris]
MPGRGWAQNGPQSQFGRTSPVAVRSSFFTHFQWPDFEPRQNPNARSERPRWRHRRNARYSNWQWHLDEVFVKINGEMHYLWRAVDHEGEVLESFVTKRRDRKAALKFIRKTMKRHGRAHILVTDMLRSYGAALKVIGNVDKQETGRWLNNRAENSHQPFRRRERAMLRFRRMRTLQKFVAVHGSVYNHFNAERHLHSRSNFKLNRAAALDEWRGLCAA